MVEKSHASLSVRTQCKLLGISRSSLDYVPVPESPSDLGIKRIIDELYLRDPCLGSRRLVTILERDFAENVNRKRLQRLRREMGLEAIWCRPRTSIPDSSHRKYPYLLRGLAVTRPDQVWCADITYVPMPHGRERQRGQAMIFDKSRFVKNRCLTPLRYTEQARTMRSEGGWQHGP